MILTCLVTFNRLAYTQRCVESYLATKRPADALIVVDNASTDGTPEWLIEHGLVTIFNPDNRYPGAATNQGWDVGLARIGRVDFLHRSDNDIEYLPGWGQEVEAAFEANSDLRLLGILNLHEDRGLDLRDAAGIEWVPRVGGNVVMRPDTFREHRWSEQPWAPGQDEDGAMCGAIGKGIGRLCRTVANNMAFGRYWDFPEYYNRTAADRHLGNPEHTV